MTETSSTDTINENAKSHFSKAIDEARAGAQALADGYREKIMQTKDGLSSEAKTRSEDAMGKASAFADDAKVKAGAFADDARVKATDWANAGKARTSQTIASLAGMLDENLSTIDEKAGAKYGDYARAASQSMKEAAASLDEKTLDELGADAKEFVRKSPGMAVGMAVAAGFMLGRMLKKGK